MHIKIGGIDYAIRYKDFDDKCGQLNRYENVIYIDGRLSKGQQQLTLWHEIFHAINGEMTEGLTESLAVSIQQIIRDNKLDLFKQEKEPKCLNRKKKSLKSRSPKKR